MRIGYLREDVDYKYIIPEDLIKDFDSQIEYLDGWSYDEWEEINNEVENPFDVFEECFEKYRVKGSLYKMKIIMGDE